VLSLADRTGLPSLLDECLSVPAPRATVKTRALLAGMLAGADDIDGMDILRAESNPTVLGEVRAPLTLGTFLRSFTHGHVLQLGRVNRSLLSGLSTLLPSLVGDGLVLVDLDAPPQAGGTPRSVSCTATRSKQPPTDTTRPRA
jgi:hypothetical protein